MIWFYCVKLDLNNKLNNQLGLLIKLSNLVYGDLKPNKIFSHRKHSYSQINPLGQVTNQENILYKNNH